MTRLADEARRLQNSQSVLPTLQRYVIAELYEQGGATQTAAIVRHYADLELEDAVLMDLQTEVSPISVVGERIAARRSHLTRYRDAYGIDGRRTWLSIENRDFHHTHFNVAVPPDLKKAYDQMRASIWYGARGVPRIGPHGAPQLSTETYRSRLKSVLRETARHNVSQRRREAQQRAARQQQAPGARPGQQQQAHSAGTARPTQAPPRLSRIQQVSGDALHAGMVEGALRAQARTAGRPSRVERLNRDAAVLRAYVSDLLTKANLEPSQTAAYSRLNNAIRTPEEELKLISAVNTSYQSDREQLASPQRRAIHARAATILADFAASSPGNLPQIPPAGSALTRVMQNIADWDGFHRVSVAQGGPSSADAKKSRDGQNRALQGLVEIMRSTAQPYTSAYEDAASRYADALVTGNEGPVYTVERVAPTVTTTAAPSSGAAAAAAAKAMGRLRRPSASAAQSPAAASTTSPRPPAADAARSAKLAKEAAPGPFD